MHIRGVLLLAMVATWILPASVFAEKAKADPPSDFVLQILEPTGGKILRPKAWFYAEAHGGPRYTWTISKEDISKGAPYTTGVRIQTFVGVKKGTGKSGKEFVLSFLSQREQDADKVVKRCSETNQGLFNRICMETEEGRFHVLYSLFWGAKDLDVVVVSISGTAKELWETYAPTFTKMSAFELIDMTRFTK